MKNILHLILLLFPIMVLQSQIHEVGVFLGGSNYVGDVGPTTFISPEKAAFGLFYKWNKSPRHSYRFSYTQSKIVSNDINSNEIGRKARGYNFENSIKEVSLGLEFNFFNFNLHDSKRKVTPYIYTGINYFRFDELYIISSDTKTAKSTGSFAIPIHLGIKSNVSPHLVLAAEVGARYTFTDNLDGSFPKEPNAIYRFGNLNNTDWYVFSGVTLSYTFGNKPCYCAQ